MKLINMLIIKQFKSLLIILLFFSNFELALGQYRNLDPDKSITQYKLRSWTIDNGLPSNAISNIIQSQDGYIWIATYGGVAKFDGIDFTKFTSYENSALYTEAAKIVCEDNDGTIWIGTQKGIALYKDSKLYRNKKLSPLDETNIESIYIDNKNQVWIGTNASGLYKYSNDSLIRVNSLDSLTNNSIFALFEDINGTLWIGTVKGELFKIKNEIIYTCDIKNSYGEIFSFFQDKEGIIWAATSNGIFTIQKDKLIKHPDLDINFAENIIEDNNGNIWISSSAYGLFRYNKTTRQTEILSEKNGLPNNRVIKIIFDKQGNLWGGTYRNGVFQISDGKFTCFSTTEGLYSNSSTAIMQYSENEFWIANEKGTINILKDGNITKLHTKIPIQSPQIKHMFKDSKGCVWISTYGGLLKICHDKEIIYNTQNGFPDNFIRKTFEDLNGNIWICTNRSGLVKINPNGEIYLKG